MAEDEQKPAGVAQPAATEAKAASIPPPEASLTPLMSSVVPSEPAPSVAPPTNAADAPAAATAKAAPLAPTNKLHEWGAAAGIMVFLAFVLYVFLNFLRSASM